MNELVRARNRANLCFVPFRRYPLRELVQKISAAGLLESGFEAGVAVFGADAKEGVQWSESPELHAFMSLAEMTKVCELIGADVLHRLLQGLLDDPRYLADNVGLPGSDEMLRYYDAFKSELDKRAFVYLPVERSEFYQNGEQFSDASKEVFPSAVQELRSASDAYAVGLSVGCVFHCMRALEHGLSALAKDVGLTWTKEQWHTIIEAVESKIEKERRSLPAGSPRDTRLRFLSSAAKEFFYFKDGWRNYVVHNRVHYEAPQALEVFVHTKAFIDRLSAALTE